MSRIVLCQPQQYCNLIGRLNIHIVLSEKQHVIGWDSPLPEGKGEGEEGRGERGRGRGRRGGGRGGGGEGEGEEGEGECPISTLSAHNLL